LNRAVSSSRPEIAQASRAGVVKQSMILVANSSVHSAQY
jgi:hypothetical protein